MTIAAGRYMKRGGALLSLNGGATDFGLPKFNSDGAATSTRATATAVGSATPHTKGAWTEVVASLASEATFVQVTLLAATNTSATNALALLDIGVGAAASETVIVPNIGAGMLQFGRTWHFPVRITAGSRVAIRCQGAEASKNIQVGLMFGIMPNSAAVPATTLDTLGANTAISGGVVIATPGVVNTKGAWTEVTAATAQAYEALAVDLSAAGDTSLLAGPALVDIGIGAAGAETVLIPDVWVSATTTTEQISVYGLTTYPVDVPAGSRLSARVSVTNLGNTFDVILHGAHQ